MGGIMCMCVFWFPALRLGLADLAAEKFERDMQYSLIHIAIISDEYE
jgi:hypothetical protein